MTDKHKVAIAKSEFEVFDGAMQKLLSVSHAELKRRERKWKKHRSRRRRTKS